MTDIDTLISGPVAKLPRRLTFRRYRRDPRVSVTLSFGESSSPSLAAAFADLDRCRIEPTSDEDSPTLWVGSAAFDLDPTEIAPIESFLGLKS